MNEVGRSRARAPARWRFLARTATLINEVKGGQPRGRRRDVQAAGDDRVGVSTSAVVFLYDTTAEGASPAPEDAFDPAFLRALSTADRDGQTWSSVLRGDPLVAELATKITAVAADEKRSSHTQSYDMDVYRTVIWDLAHALSQQWNTVSLETFPLVLANRAVQCICVPTLPTEFREELDRLLQGNNGVASTDVV